MTPTTRTDYDRKLDAIERIINQVRRYDGAQAADLIVYGRVPIKELAQTELEPEEIASAAMGGVTNEYRPGLPPIAMRKAHSEWIDGDGDKLFFSPDGARYVWHSTDASPWWSCFSDALSREILHPIAPLGCTWSQIESLAGGEGRR
jgi:hypothetical protein